MSKDLTRGVPWRRIGFHWVACLLEQLLLLPIWLAIDTYLVPEAAKGLWLIGLPILSLTGAAFAHLPLALWKRISIALVMGCLFAAIVVGVSWYALPMFAVGLITLLQAMSVQNRIWDLKLYWLGIAGYFFAGLIFANVPALEGYLPALSAAGCLCVAVALFLTNLVTLRGASFAADGGRGVPSALRRHNRIYVGVIIAGVVLLTAAIGNLLGATLLAGLRAVLRWLLTRPQPDPEPLPPPETAPMQPLLPIDSAEPSLLSKLLDILVYTVFTLALIAAAVYLLVWLYRNGGGMWKRWIDRLLSFLLRSSKQTEEGAGYVDEETGVFHWDAVKLSVRESLFGRFFRGRGEERWEDIGDNRERVRYLYRRWLRALIASGYRGRASLTPAETAADVERWEKEKAEESGRGKSAKSGKPDPRLIALYNQARYSNGGIDDEEVEKLRKFLP
jgi:hypothetical protein